MATLFTGRGLTRIFGGGGDAVRALDGLDFDIGKGELVAVCGPSGAGKTTLLEILGLLDGGYEGQLLFRGGDAAKLSAKVRARRRLSDMGFIYQRFHLLEALTVRDNVALPHWRLHGDERRARSRAEALVSELGLEARLQHTPAKLSAGEQQRVAIARALVNDPQVLLADEPTGSLDAESAKAVVTALKRANQAGRTVVMVSHDEKIQAIATKRLQLRFGALEPERAD